MQVPGVMTIPASQPKPYRSPGHSVSFLKSLRWDLVYLSPAQSLVGDGLFGARPLTDTDLSLQPPKPEQIITRYQYHLRPQLFLYISRPQWKLQDTSPSYLSDHRAIQIALMNSSKGAPTWRYSHFCFIGLARS